MKVAVVGAAHPLSNGATLPTEEKQQQLSSPSMNQIAKHTNTNHENIHTDGRNNNKYINSNGNNDDKFLLHKATPEGGYKIL
eukprot:3309521-Ditylum_brightwellii.AAC.1